MNDLEKYFRQNTGNLIVKWNHYFDIYERHFERFRNKEVVILEIGIFQGGSLQMWKNYFGDKAKIYGLDVNPQCKQFEDDNIKIFIGSQDDRNFLNEVKKQIPPIDIIIDDGGHRMRQQIISFEELFDHVKDDGIYLCEDVHTSYWLKFGGGIKRRGTFIEYSKNFIDYLHADHSEQKSLSVNKFTRSINAVHFYECIVVFEKKKREKQFYEAIGNYAFEETIKKQSLPVKIFRQSVLFALLKINAVLRFFKLKGFVLR